MPLHVWYGANMAERREWVTEHVSDYQAGGCWFSTRAKVVVEYTPDELGALKPTAVLQYGPLTSEALRQLSIRELESPGPGVIFDPGPPPSVEDLAHAWGEGKKVRLPMGVEARYGSEAEEEDAFQRLNMLMRNSDLSQVVDHIQSSRSETAHLTRAWLTRRDGDPAENFYRRVAVTYRALIPQTTKPVTLMSRIAGVPQPTMASYIHRARGRGLIPTPEESSDE